MSDLPLQPITSPQNPLVKRCRRLQEKPRARREEGIFPVEGLRLVGEAFRAGVRPQAVLVADPPPEAALPWLRAWAAQGVPLYRLPVRVLRRAAATETPQGILALCPLPHLPWPECPDFLLLADNLRDPGNLGTLLRTAWAVGVQGVVLPPGTVDPFNPKVVRAAMGAHFHLPLRTASWEEIPTLVRGTTLYIAEAHGGVPYTEADWRVPLTLVVGSEAHGPSAVVRRWPHRLVHLPMPGGAESLNAAIAAAVLMFEVLRQRQSPR